MKHLLCHFLLRGRKRYSTLVTILVVGRVDRIVNTDAALRMPCHADIFPIKPVIEYAALVLVGIQQIGKRQVSLFALPCGRIFVADRDKAPLCKMFENRLVSRCADACAVHKQHRRILPVA